MSKLCEMSKNGSLKNLMFAVCEFIEQETGGKLAIFNAVLEDEKGHCVVSMSEREEKRC